MDQQLTIAVFDVDETLIHCKSMFSFLRFALSSRFGEPQGHRKYQAALHRIRLARADMPREAVNRLFYREFNGWNIAELRALSEDWFKKSQDGDFYINEMREKFRAHAEKGDVTVLLSGSAEIIIQPIANDLGATTVIAIRLKELSDGTTDGGIAGIQTIGRGKALALQIFLDSLSWKPRLIGYGDHESDLPFLNMCDEAFVVTHNGKREAWMTEFHSPICLDGNP